MFMRLKIIFFRSLINFLSNFSISNVYRMDEQITTHNLIKKKHSNILPKRRDKGTKLTTQINIA